MSHGRTRIAKHFLVAALAAAPLPALAAEVTAKVVWLDARNMSLLLECPDKGCEAIPNAKPGETYTFVVPANLKAAATALKEGQTVTLVYQDEKDRGYRIASIK